MVACGPSCPWREDAVGCERRSERGQLLETLRAKLRRWEKRGMNEVKCCAAGLLVARDPWRVFLGDA